MFGGRSTVGLVLDSVSFVAAPPKNLTTFFFNSFDNSQHLMSLTIESPMITDTFLKFSQTFVMKMSLLLFVSAGNWFDEAVSWSGMAMMWSSACLFVISESVWWNYVLIKNICYVIFFIFFCYIIFHEVLVLTFLCPFLLWKLFWFWISAWIMQVLFFLLTKMINLY